MLLCCICIDFELHSHSQEYGLPQLARDIIAIACSDFRPEMKFDGIGALIARIKTDAGIASKQLDTDQYERLKKEYFS